VTLLAFGINHKTAPVAIREKVAFAPDQVATALTDLTNNSPVTEAAIISTCNRTELICELEFPDTDSVLYWFGKYHGIEHALLKPYVYNHPDREAVRHILRVASGLDSLVLGEPQILGQVKTAYVQAKQQTSLYKTGIIPQAIQTVSSMLAAYQVNKVDFLNLVRAQITLYNYETQYWKVLAEANQSQARLDAAIGRLAP